MPFPLLLLLLVGGAAVVAVSRSEQQPASPLTLKRIPGTPSRIPTLNRIPGTPSRIPTPQEVTDAAINGAASFASLLKSASDGSAVATSAELEARAKQYADERVALERETLAKWNRDVDMWRNAITTGLEYSGIGLALVPFVYAGASIMKWGAKASAWLGKALTGTGDAWSTDWQRNAESEREWLASRNILFQGFQPNRDTPRGWCTGRNLQNEPMQSGTSALRESFQRMPPNDAARAMSAFDVVARHRDTNPFARAAASALQLAATEPNYGAGMLVPSADVLRLSKSKDNGERYLAAFQWCLVAAIAVGVAQDYKLQTSDYQRIIEAAWRGWDKAARIYQDAFFAQPPGEWRPGVIGVGYAGFPIAAAFAYATEEAKK